MAEFKATKALFDLQVCTRFGWFSSSNDIGTKPHSSGHALGVRGKNQRRSGPSIALWPIALSVGSPAPQFALIYVIHLEHSAFLFKNASLE